MQFFNFLKNYKSVAFWLTIGLCYVALRPGLQHYHQEPLEKEPVIPTLSTARHDIVGGALISNNQKLLCLLDTWPDLFSIDSLEVKKNYIQVQGATTESEDEEVFCKDYCHFKDIYQQTTPKSNTDESFSYTFWF